MGFILLRTSVDEESQQKKKIKKKGNFKQLPKMPNCITTNVQLQQLAKCMHIPYFRGIFKRTNLPTEGVY